MPDRHGNIDWAQLVPIRGRARYQPGTIFAPGKVFEECGIRIVLEGTVRFSILAADGKEQVLAYLPKGSIFGEQAALGRVPLHADNFVAIVDEPSEIGTLWASDLIAAFQRRSDVFADLMRISAEKTSLIVQAATRSAFGSARARIINVLSMLRQGNDNHVSITQERLAKLCGTSRVTVATQLHELEKDGVLHLSRCSIKICDSKRFGSMNAASSTGCAISKIR